MRTLFALFLAMLVLCPSSNASDATIPQAITLGTIDNLPPFEYVLNGKLTGIDIDLVNELARRLAISIEIKTFPWARVLTNLRTGKIDGAFAAYTNKEREEYCIYIDILHFDELGISVRKDHEFKYSQTSDLYGKRIGKGTDVFVGEELTRAINENKIIVEEVNDMGMANIKKLHAGRLDAVIGSVDTMLHYARTLGFEDDITILEKRLQEKTPAYLVMSKASTLKNMDAIETQMRRTLEEMRRDGTYDAIHAKHMNIFK